MQNEILEFILSLRWLWIVAIFLGYRILKNLVSGIIKSVSLKSDIIIRDTSYNEETIINHLDYIINEALDEYVLLNITPKHIYYINSKIENEIMVYLSEEVPKRISKTLLTHLSFIYDNEYVGEFIGKHIYLILLNYVLTYNINNEISENPNPDIKK